MPDHAPLVLLKALLRGLRCKVLVGSGNLLVPSVKEDEVAKQVEEPGAVEELPERHVQKSPPAEC
jgi:hypothetical protein